jgi:glycosyltransferase involved in cell wall biosynthesis
MDIEVSIIIPVYNKANYLGDCLDSVSGQSFGDIEIICIDDASDDRCAEILEDYASRDARLDIITNDKNLGPAESRNKGIEAAKGRFLRFVDADDLLPHESTEALYKRAIEDGVEVVKGSLALFRDNDTSTLLDVITVADKTRTQLLNEKDLWVPWWHTSYLISAELVRENDLRYPDLIRGEDPVFLASVLINTKFLSLVSDIVYLYRKYQKISDFGGSTMQHVKDYVKHAAETKRLFTSHYPECWYGGYGPFLIKGVRGFLNICELDESQQRVINAELTKIWGNDAWKI